MMTKHIQGKIDAPVFRRRIRNLILLTWTIPPVFGLSFLLYIDMFTPAQMLDILLSPVEPLFNLAWIGFSAWYLPRKLSPLSRYLENPAAANATLALDCMRRFPVNYWGLFILYLLMAPSTVIFSATYYADFTATPVDWFRIHLVALIVSIIVGLPIFFRILDLFGQVVGRLQLTTPHITLKARVFLIGSLVPLLIDTMLVQYYWTRTGYFTLETFLVWLTLEVIALAGSFIFVRSIGQSLAPLEELIRLRQRNELPDVSRLTASSTDELGVLANDYRELLDELYRHRHQLEEMVALRTRELTNSNRELESFAHSTSHDLRAPLRAINGFAHSILEDYASEIDPELATRLERIIAETSRMSNIIDAMLKLSRVSRSEIRRESIDLSDIASQSLKNFTDLTAGRRLEYHVSKNMRVHADRSLAKILLDNLIHNALKFTADNPAARIEIGMQMYNGHEFICVADNGIGFDMRHADRLFKAFQRLHSDKEYDGLGIGLATVQRVVMRHGGEIHAVARPGEGARFYFRLQ